MEKNMRGARLGIYCNCINYYIGRTIIYTTSAMSKIAMLPRSFTDIGENRMRFF